MIHKAAFTMMLVVFVSLLGGCTTTPPITLEQRAQRFSDVPKRELTGTEKKAIEKAIKGSLKDPNSAMFKWEKFVGTGSIYCGYVNSKNSFGGYVGYSPYQVFVTPAGKDVVVGVVGIGTGNSEGSQNRAIQETCANNGYFVYR